ncbi:hypothetical protein [Brucella intermedia]|uniref:hypothetical protein n=1 Tax=Brucella intermedia TaxID=94625 RepID=UPI002362AB37|nr:hypothetical protein [Brucella intermedia]
MTQTLITRLSKLDAPDREVDWLIADHFDEIPKHTIREIGWDYDWWRGPNEYSLKKAIDSEGRRIDTWYPNTYTASIDAAIALAERVLPGWKWRVGRTEVFPNGWAYVHKYDPSNCDRIDEAACADGKAANPAIALLIALLRAKEASL